LLDKECWKVDRWFEGKKFTEVEDGLKASLSSSTPTVNFLSNHGRRPIKVSPLAGQNQTVNRNF
jgi:hypothetical protein